MTLKEWCICPNCEFPALYNEFKDVVAKTSQCPMCAVNIDPATIALAANPQDLLRGVKENTDPVSSATTKEPGTIASSNAGGVWAPGGVGANTRKEGGLVAMAAM
jgi:hypothetical protein